MRLPKLRFSLRLLLVLVAIAAIALGAWVLVQRAREYRKRAAMYAQEEQQATIKERILVDFINKFNDISEMKENTESQAKITAHFAQLRRKYEYAAKHPWLSVEPDPLPPDSAMRVRYWLEHKEYGRALQEYETNIKTNRDLAFACRGRAWIWATCPDPKYRDGKRAVESATRACELAKWKDYENIGALAAAYAETADFAAAVHWQQESLRLMREDDSDRPAFRYRLSLYEQHKPCRDQQQTE